MMIDYQIFAEATTVDKILLWMSKCAELVEVSKLLSAEDARILMKVLRKET